jgi:hypothetical protein
MAYEDHLSDQAADVLRYGFGLRVAPHEVEGALSLSFELARRRAEQQYARPPTPIEVALVGSLLCWYPLKGPPSPAYTNAIAPVQVELFERGLDDAETSEATSNVLGFLSSASTDDLLTALASIADEEPTDPLRA